MANVLTWCIPLLAALIVSSKGSSVLVERGQQTIVSCNVPKDVSSITWQLLDGGAPVNLSTCRVLDTNCTNDISSIYQGFINVSLNSASENVFLLNVTSARLNETDFTCLADDLRRFNVSIEVYDPPKMGVLMYFECPYGDGVKEGVISVGSTAYCQCSLDYEGVPKSFPRWFTRDGKEVGVEDTSEGISTLNFTYDYTDPSQSYECRAVNPLNISVEPFVFTPIFSNDYMIAEMGKELHLECSFPSNVTSIDWYILRGTEAINISTCSVVDGNCTDLMPTFYNATISSSGGITTAGLNVDSVRINETLLSCVSNNGFRNTTQLDVYARPSKPQCKQQVLSLTIVFTCTTDNSYPGFVPLLHAREMNFNDNPTSILYSSNNTLEVRSAVLTWEIQFRYTKPSMIIYIELIPTLSNLSLIRDAAVFSDDVVTPLSMPEVVLNPTLCPFGPGVSDKKIKKGTTASCKCDLKSAGVPPGSVQWYSQDGSIVDESKNKEDGSSNLTFTYNPKDKDQSYECRSVSEIQGTRSTMAFTPIFISAAQPTVINGLQPMVIILGVIIYGVVSHLG